MRATPWLPHLIPIATAISLVPDAADTLTRQKVSVIGPATRVTHVPPTAVMDDVVICVVADGKFDAVSDWICSVNDVPMVKQCTAQYRYWPDATAPASTTEPVTPVADMSPGAFSRLPRTAPTEVVPDPFVD